MTTKQSITCHLTEGVVWPQVVVGPDAGCRGTIRFIATNSVTVNGITANRKGEYFRAGLPMTNGVGPIWTNTTVAGTGQSSVTGAVVLATTTENFTYDADGNLTRDGRWSYAWEGENRLVDMTGLSTGPVGSKFKLDFIYYSKGRRIQKLVSTNNGSVYGPQYTNRFVQVNPL